MKSIVITGVSTGIGEATATVFTKAGWRVFGSVRKADDGDRLKATLGPNYHALLLDVIDEAAIGAAAAQVRTTLDGRKLDGLINNAGISVAGPLEHLPSAEFRQQIETNLIGPFLVTKAFLPLLGTDRTLDGAPGRIVNMSSVGGRIGPPFISGYAASKHGLEGLSESLRRELLLFGIDVIIVGPGSVATPIWTKTGSPKESPYARTAYGPAMVKFFTAMVQEGLKGYPPAYIGERLLGIMETARPRSRYALVPGRLTNWALPTLLPRRWVDRLIGRAVGLQPIDRLA